MKTLERLDKNLTQCQLSKLLGVDQTAVSKWENGDTFPRANRLSKIAKTLGCTTDELLAQHKKAVHK